MPNINGVQISFSRQTDIFNPEGRKEKVEIIGAGAIGSFSALAIAKMGIKNIKIWDDDHVEEHNFPNQFYRLEDLNKYKIDALNNIIFSFTRTFVETTNSRVDETSQLTGDIVIVAVDNMDTRKMIFELVKTQKVKFLIDARMGGEVMRVFTLDMGKTKEIKQYSDSLYSHSEASPLPCSARSIIYNVMVASGLVANQVKKVLNGESYPIEVIFDMKTMSFLSTSIKEVKYGNNCKENNGFRRSQVKDR